MEKLSYQAFRDNVMYRGDRITRVESPITPGIPDVSCCLRPGVEFWMEIKSPIEPVQAKTPLFGSNHKVRPDQINWMLTQTQAGGLGFFFIDTDCRRMFIPGKHAIQVNKMTVGELWNVSIWNREKPTPKTEWEALRQAIFEFHKKTLDLAAEGRL